MSHKSREPKGNHPHTTEPEPPTRSATHPGFSQGPARHYQHPPTNPGGSYSDATQREKPSNEVPTGFRLISGWLCVIGLFACYVGVMLLQASSAASWYAGSGSGSTLTVIALFSLCLGGVHVLAAYRTWTFHPAGWKLGVAMLGTGAGIGIFAVLNGGSTMGLLTTLLYGGAAWYLYTNEELYRTLQCQPVSADGQPQTDTAHPSSVPEQDRLPQQ